MGDEERNELLSDVKKVVHETLTLHHRNNGYVNKGVCDANTQLLRQGMEAVAGAVERVHGEVKEQRKATDDLNKITGKLNTELVRHTAEHAGIEKAEMSQTDIERLKTGRWKRWLGLAAVIVGLLGLLGSAGAWFVSEMKDAVKQDVKVVVTKEAAKEIVRLSNGGGGTAH